MNQAHSSLEIVVGIALCSLLACSRSDVTSARSKTFENDFEYAASEVFDALKPTLAVLRKQRDGKEAVIASAGEKLSPHVGTTVKWKANIFEVEERAVVVMPAVTVIEPVWFLAQYPSSLLVGGSYGSCIRWDAADADRLAQLVPFGKAEDARDKTFVILESEIIAIDVERAVQAGHNALQVTFVLSAPRVEWADGQYSPVVEQETMKAGDEFEILRLVESDIRQKVDVLGDPNLTVYLTEGADNASVQGRVDVKAQDGTIEKDVFYVVRKTDGIWSVEKGGIFKVEPYIIVK